MSKAILCLDFDGVIHSYSSGWKGAGVIPDPPVPGALSFIVRASEHFIVAIFSSRSGQPGGISAMQEWLIKNMVTARFLQSMDCRDRETKYYESSFRPFVISALKWPTEKPAAMVTIDDRAIQFTGTWPAVDELLRFQPWYLK